MAERIHPRPDSPPTSLTTSSTTSGEASYPGAPSAKPSYPPPSNPVPPPPATYVVQLPKDQIYGYPPTDNTRRYNNLSSRKPRRSCCCRCLCFTLCFLLVLIIAVGISAGVIYLVYKPEAPKYTISNVSIKNLNLTSSSPASPEFDVTVRADNPNDKIAIFYRKGSSVNVYYNDVKLCSGSLPAFYQPSNNLTVFQTALKGSNIELTSGLKTALSRQQRQGRVPFRMDLKAPVKIKIGSVKTWEITIKVKCDVVMDGLTEISRIVSKDCDYSVRLW